LRYIFVLFGMVNKNRDVNEMNIENIFICIGQSILSYEEYEPDTTGTNTEEIIFQMDKIKKKTENYYLYFMIISILPT